MKKKVTWAYFSVSAIRSWVLPFFARYSPRVLVSVWGLKATVSLSSKVLSYWVMDT